MFCRKPRLGKDPLTWSRQVERPPGGVRGGCVSWENLRNLLKRKGPIWNQLGKKPGEIKVAPGTHAPPQRTSLLGHFVGRSEQRSRPWARSRGGGGNRCARGYVRVRVRIMKPSYVYSATCHHRYSSVRNACIESRTVL